MRAIVFSSGASTIEMKSKCPSVAHWALTVAPSCSTSLLTSRMRAGLFLTVWTPSGVSVESMMYVGTGLPPWLAGGARARCIRSFPPHAVFRSLMHLLRPILGAAVAALLVPQAAQAAMISPLGACYRSVDAKKRENVPVHGEDFTPGQTVKVLIDGQVVAEGIKVLTDGKVDGV